MTAPDAPFYLERPDGARLACRKRAGAGPGVLWLGGYRSDMAGTKAEALDAFCAARGQAFVRFDYFGHGQSDGDYRDGTISRWLDDAVAALEALTEGPQILVGSSMGGWIATLLALAAPARVAGLVYIAPAPDFTEELMWKRFSPEIKKQIETEGYYDEPSQYGPEPNRITKALIEDGRRHLLLGGPIDIKAPVRILQGMADPDVPWRHAMRLAEALVLDDVEIVLTKAGDHRLSTPEDLARLKSVLAALSDIKAA
ncbi:MAG: alpha/beta hydrolase [Pseudomonadota bacterium]